MPTRPGRSEPVALMTEAALYALFDRSPELGAGAIGAQFGDDATVTVNGPMVEIGIGEHRAKAVVLDAPLPEDELERTLPLAHLRPDQKSRLREHTSHAVVTCEGDTDAADVFMLYALAASLDDGALLGVVNPVTGMALDASMLSDTLEEDFIDAFLEHPASSLGLWLGFVKLFRPDGAAWLVTRGGDLVGLPNLGFLVASLDETDRIYDLFVSVLDYITDSGADLAVGHTLEFAGEQLRLVAPYEYEDWIGASTLVIERVVGTPAS